MKLLAVSQTNQGLKPASADLYLEVKPGEGRVFINTLPLTKVDTQVSFRLAKEYACDYLNYDCSNLDFLYMIRSDSPIVGGPSAGAAATSLTVIVLDNLDFDEESSITGTINSGGMIGPVGGIKEKIEAANEMGLKKVVIPEGERYFEATNKSIEQNQTLDLVEYGASLGIKIVEVADITQGIFEITGKNYSSNNNELELDPEYVETMKGIAIKLCDHSKELLLGIDTKEIVGYEDFLEDAENLTNYGSQAFEQGLYYSAASYCHGANVKYHFLVFVSQNLSNGNIITIFDDTETLIMEANKDLENFEYKTITDLQTYLIVKERLGEAEDQLNNARKYLVQKRKEDAVYELAVSIERINSADSWSEFFGNAGKRFYLNKESLREVCLNKISEAEERMQYVNSFITLPLDDMKGELDKASLDFDVGDYELCIYKASKVKARTDLILSAVGLDKEDVNRLLERKLAIVEEVIAKETQRGIFPIMGYSYFEYAKSLQSEDPISALLYSEFALELSNFNIYFEPEKRFKIPNIDFGFVFVFVFGTAVGFLFAMSLRFAKQRKTKVVKKRIIKKKLGSKKKR